MDRVAVFIDGSNFYNKLKELGIRHTPNFNYRGLAEWLAHGRAIVYCGYYVGSVFFKTYRNKLYIDSAECKRCGSTVIEFDIELCAMTSN